MNEQDQRLLLPEEVAEILHVSVKTVHRLCREGKLAYILIDSRGTRRFTLEQIEAFIEAQSIQAPKSVDKARPQTLSFPRKGGDHRKSTGDSLLERKRMREELRSWR